MTTQGAFVWYDLMTTDMPAAEDLFGAVVAGQARDSGMPGHAYSLFTVDERPAAGLMTLPQEARDMGVPPVLDRLCGGVGRGRRRRRYAGGRRRCTQGPGGHPGRGSFRRGGRSAGRGALYFPG